VIGPGIHIVYEDEYKVCKIVVRGSIASETGGTIYDLVCKTHSGWEFDRVPLATERELMEVCRICEFVEPPYYLPNEKTREEFRKLCERCEACISDYLKAVALLVLGKITMKEYAEWLRDIEKLNRR
jgi:hypothetical protein